MYAAGLKKDFGSTAIVCAALCVGMLSLLGCRDYCSYALLPLLPLVLFEYRKVDRACLLLLAFSAVYTFWQYVNGYHYSPSSILFGTVFPFIVYQAGGLIVEKQHNPKSAVVLILCMMSCLAIPAIVANVYDAVETGQFVNESRKILNSAGDISRKPTVYGMMLCLLNGCLALVFIKASDSVDKWIKFVLLVFCAGALFSTVHLVNRTGIAIAMVSMAAAAVLPPYSLKKNGLQLGVFVLISALMAFIYNHPDSCPAIFDSYKSRDAGVGSVDTLGGRVELWKTGIAHLFGKPFGSAEGVVFEGYHTYAHNMWIDAGIRGSIFSSILILLFSAVYIRNLAVFYKYVIISRFEKNIMLIVGVTLMLQFAVEPVIEGEPQLFWFFIFTASVIIHLNRKYRDTECCGKEPAGA